MTEQQAGEATRPSGGPQAPESAKRKQILDGARRVFLARGFAAASMGEIARDAGVSKGTLYVYFDSKEALFRALMAEKRDAAAERFVILDEASPNVAGALTDFGIRLIEKLCDEDHIALLRVVVGASDQFPRLARTFFESGPAFGAQRLSAWLAAQAERGLLDITDPDTAAWQFLGMCNHPTLTATVLGCEQAPERYRPFVEAAVRTFLAAYGPRPS